MSVVFLVSVVRVIVMAVIVDLRSRRTLESGDFADKHAIIQVEKWMAIIREIGQERLSSGLFTNSEIDERTTAMLAMLDKFIEGGSNY